MLVGKHQNCPHTTLLSNSCLQQGEGEGGPKVQIYWGETVVAVWGLFLGWAVANSNQKMLARSLNHSSIVNKLSINFLMSKLKQILIFENYHFNKVEQPGSDTLAWQTLLSSTKLWKVCHFWKCLNKWKSSYKIFTSIFTIILGTLAMLQLTVVCNS